MSSEWAECLARGVTPIFFLTPSLQEFIQRNVLFVPSRITALLGLRFGLGSSARSVCQTRVVIWIGD